MRPPRPGPPVEGWLLWGRCEGAQRSLHVRRGQATDQQQQQQPPQQQPDRREVSQPAWSSRSRGGCHRREFSGLWGPAGVGEARCVPRASALCEEQVCPGSALPAGALCWGRGGRGRAGGSREGQGTPGSRTPGSCPPGAGPGQVQLRGPCGVCVEAMGGSWPGLAGFLGGGPAIQPSPSPCPPPSPPRVSPGPGCLAPRPRPDAP